MRKFVSTSIKLVVLFAVVTLHASDTYVYPGGLNSPIYHWTYPDIATMQADTGFFAQDLGKLAFIPNNTFVGAGALYRLGDTTPSFAWAGGDPLRYAGGDMQVIFPITNGTTQLSVQNASIGNSAIAGLEVLGGDSDFTMSVYSPAYSGGGLGGEPFVVDGVTITNTRGPLILNPNGGVRLYDNNVVLGNGLAEISATTGRLVTSKWTPQAFGGGGYQYTNNQNASTFVFVNNANANGSALAGFQACSDSGCADLVSFPTEFIGGTVNVAGSAKVASIGQLTLSSASGGAIVFTTDGETSEAGRIEVSGAGYKGPTTPRTASQVSNTTVTPNTDTTDRISFTSLAANLTINAPTGTPRDGQRLRFYIKDNGVSRTLSWNAIYHNSPLTVTGAKVSILEFEYSTTTTSWDKISQQNF